MAVRLDIYHKGGSTAFYSVEKWTFNDKFMGEQNITFTAQSHEPIEWAVGDYCLFRGEEYTLGYIPSATQKASIGSRMDAFVYESIKFESHSIELSSCMMLDVTPSTGRYKAVLGTNYTGSATFQLYCGESVVNGKVYPPVCVLAAKMQANLDRLYPGSGWDILVDTDTTYIDNTGARVLVTHTDDKTLTFDNTTVAKALADVHDIFDLNYSIKGRTIRIGYALGNITSESSADAFAFGYGEGYPTKYDSDKGLFQIRRIANNNQLIVTRLRAMGSTKNIPYRYYFKKYASDNQELTQALIVNNLQLPGTFLPEGTRTDTGTSTKWGLNNRRADNLRKVLGDTNDAYIDKGDDATTATEGIHEYSAKWDGSDSNLPEIYPTIEDTTYGDLRNAGIQDQEGRSGSGAFPNYQASEFINELLAIGYMDGSSLVDDANTGDGFLPENGGSGGGRSYNAEIQASTASFNTTDYGDFTPQSGYFSLSERELFTVQGVTKGRYYLTPTESSVYFKFAVTSTSTSTPLSIGYIVSIYQRTKLTGDVTLRARYISDFVQIVPTDGIKEVIMPRIPDVEMGDDAKVKENVLITELSDVIVKFTPIIRNNLTSSYSGTLTFGIGNSSKSGASTAEPMYTWVEADNSKGQGTFHVFIKDMGFDLSAQLNGETPAIAMKTGACVGREFEIGSSVEKVVYNGKRGYMITLNRAEDSNLGTYYPSEVNRISAGDKFVILNIDMPDAYIEAAEVRLLKAATDYLADNDETKFTYQPYIDDIYLQRNIDLMESAGTPELSVFHRLYAGLKMTFRGIPVDSDEMTPLPLIELTVANVKIDMGAKITPQVELTLNDDVEQTTIQKLTTAVDRIYNGSLFNNGKTSSSSASSTAMLLSLIQSEGGKLFLSKIKDDTAKGDLTFDGETSFNGTATHNGQLVTQSDLNANGQSTFNGASLFNGNLTVDDLARMLVRGSAEFRGQTVITAEGMARVLSRVLFGQYSAGATELGRTGGVIDKDGNAELQTLLVRSLTKITEGVFQQLTGATESAGTMTWNFTDGFGGNGMRLWKDDAKGWCMTLDTLTVRRTMYVFELVIQKIRAVGGILLVSAADGKIDTVQEVHAVIDNHYVPCYLITFEDRNTFVQHDLMRCQRWSGGNYSGFNIETSDTDTIVDTSSAMKYYWVEVDASQGDSVEIYDDDENPLTLGEKDILVRKDRFGYYETVDESAYFVGSVPESGDECVLMGNTTDTARQNYIMISAAEDGVPRIDIMTGCDSVGDAGDLRTRVGCLDGIIDSYWQGTEQPNGYGLYSDNAWLKGKFIVRINGQDKDAGTQFEVLDGLITSTLKATRQDLIGEMGHIRNNMFLDALSYWYYYAGGEIYVFPGTSVTLMSLDGHELADATGTTLNDSTGLLVSTGGTDYAKLVSDDLVGMDVLEIKASNYTNRRGILQKNADMRDLPPFDTDPDTGDIIKKSFMLSLYYYAEATSVIYTDLNGDVENNYLTTTDGKYHKLTVPYQWDGRGDLAIYGYGHFRIYGIVLTTNVDETLLDRYVTEIRQTATEIESKATAYVEDPVTGEMTPVLFSDWIQTYNGFTQTVTNRFTNMESTISQTADNITLAVAGKIADQGNKYLYNPSFAGFEKWQVTGNMTGTYDYVRNVVEDGTSVLDVLSGNPHSIRQRNADFKELPTIPQGMIDKGGYPVYLEFYIEVLEASQVSISLGTVNLFSGALPVASGFTRQVFRTRWDATGDFYFSVDSGHVRIRSLVLNADTDAVTSSLISITSDQILAQVSSDITSATSGMVVESDFASLFSTQVNSQGVAKTAEIKTYVNNEIAGIKITADKIDLRGYTTINDGFSVDTNGNATMNNATIAGVLNNLIQSKTFASANERWDFNPLEWGSVIEWTPFGSSDSHLLVLPCAYASNGSGNMAISSATGMSMRDLRQCVGKKFTFLCTTPSLNSKITIQSGDSGNGFLMHRRDYNGTAELDLSGISTGAEIAPSVTLTREFQIANVLGLYYFTAECKMGMYNGFECIYWEIYKSAKRGEVAYTVSGDVTANGSAAVGAVIEFTRGTDSSIFRTVTDRHGHYSIALFADQYDIRYYADSTTSQSTLVQSAYEVTGNGTKNITITA